MGVAVKSEITGNVWKIEVSTGSAVARGDVLVILESMKMEIPIEAPASGICTLHVAEGQVIQEGEVIAVID